MNSNLIKNKKKTTEAMEKVNESSMVQKKSTSDASTQADRISTKTVSDDLDELYSRWKMELDIIKGLKNRLIFFQNEYTIHAKEMKDLEDKERIESNRRKMRLKEKESVKIREEEQRKRSLAAKETKKLKDAVIAKCKEVERQKEFDEQKKVKEAEEQKLKVKNNKKRKELIEKEKNVKKVTSEDWKRDFGFKKPNNVAAHKPRTYIVPGSPVPRYKKPYIARKDIPRIDRETIILSDDDNSQRLMKRTPLLEKLGKAVKRAKYPIHAKNLNLCKKVIEDDETESESDDDSLFYELPKKITRFETETVDIDEPIPGTSSQWTNCDEFLLEDELDEFID